MDFPVLSGKDKHFPGIEDSMCPVCKSKAVWADNETIELSGGCRDTDDLHNANVHSDLWLDWWSQKDKQGLQSHTELAIANHVESPAYQLAFCSTDCLRQFLNSAIDSLESQIEDEKSA
ncbi:MAG: hypothetical protein HRU20_20730 [Pseudomonadales bacterium]|nr:hypothetical protein [Pseudomonadales bacterium]